MGAPHPTSANLRPASYPRRRRRRCLPRRWRRPRSSASDRQLRTLVLVTVTITTMVAMVTTEVTGEAREVTTTTTEDTTIGDRVNFGWRRVTAKRRTGASIPTPAGEASVMCHARLYFCSEYFSVLSACYVICYEHN